MKNKKGFTLVELLAVIMILAIVMILGITAVVPLIIRGKKNSLGNEGLAFVDAAKIAHEKELYPNSKLQLRDKASYCFSMNDLKNLGYYDKDDDSYYGSVYIYYDSRNSSYEYMFWISNSNFHISGGLAGDYEVEDGSGNPEEMTSCNGNAGTTNPELPSFELPYVIYRASSNISNNGDYTETIGDYEVNIYDLIDREYTIYCYNPSGDIDCNINERHYSDDSYYANNPNYTSAVITRPYYLKHFTYNETIDDTYTCVFGDGREFCIYGGYWIDGDNNGNETSAMLKQNIESALNISLSNNELNYDGYDGYIYNGGSMIYANFQLNDIIVTCGVTINGYSYCGVNFDGACHVNANNQADCKLWES